MKPLKSTLKVVCLIFLILIISCKDKTPKPNPALASIDLKRGELLLCSTEPFGEVSFSIDCNYEVRETFDLAISLLHSFEYAEAEKAFVKVIDMDPECAMAYWGVTMSIYHDLWAPPSKKDLKKGLQLLKITESLPKSEIAAQYIDAISVFYNDSETKDHHERELLYEKKMEALYNANNNDAEATVFYALALTSTADPNDKTYKNQRKAGALLEKLFVEKPNHPGIAHYIIHSYDYPELAQMGLNTARRYAEIAPASAHAQHMPSHIFTRLGLWDESINTNINSASSAICYAESVNPEAHWTQEIHAIDYLVYAYLQKGDNKKALEQLKEMQAVKTVFPKDDFASVYALTAIPVRVALENKNWKEVANLELPKIDFTWGKFSWEKAILHFGKSLGYSHIGNIASAERELLILKDLHQNLLDSKNNFAKTYKANQVQIQIYAAQGWINLAKGNEEEALASMKLAAKLESETSKHPITPSEVLPADELLGDMLLALNKPTEALFAYEVNLKGHPGRFNGIYGVAKAAEKSGNQEKAKYYFEQLIELTKSSNCDRSELVEAKSYIAKTVI